MAAQRRIIDRRIQKTRKLLRESLMALILERKYETIVVQDILDRANVGRSTFYAHFNDKDDLLESGFQELNAMLRSAQSVALPASARPHERIISFSLPMFEHALGHRPIYKATIGSSAGATVRRSIERVISGLIADELNRDLQSRKRTSGGIPVELLVQCLASTFMSVLIWWLERSSPLEPKMVNELFRSLALPMLGVMVTGQKAIAGPL